MVDRCCDSIQGQMVVEAARRWIGTPYVHQASSCQVGTDCLGLLRGIWRETVGPEREFPGAYSPSWAEAAGDEPMLSGLARHLSRISQNRASCGDVLVFRMREQAAAKHLAVLCSQSIKAPNATMIHAYSGHSVVETRLSAAWIRRIAGAFRLPAPDLADLHT